MDPSLEKTFRGHKNYITSVSFSPSQNQLASSAGDSSILLWRLKAHSKPCKLIAHSGIVTRLKFSPKGDILASASKDKTVRLWSATDDIISESQVLKGHIGPVRSVEFSKGGQFVVTGSDDKTAKVWGCTSRRAKCTLVGHSNWVQSACFGSDAGKAVTCGDDKCVKIWDTRTHLCVHTFQDHTDAVNCVRVCHDGNSILSCSADHLIHMYDTRSKHRVKQFAAHWDAVSCIDIHPSGNYMVSSSRDASLRIWDLREKRLLFTLQGHSGGVNSVAFSEDGSYVASGGLDKLVMIWKSNLHMLHMDCDGNETALPSEDDYGMSMNTSGDCVGSPGCEWVPTDSERGQSTLPQSSSQLEQSDILKKSMSMESESTLTLKMNAILAQLSVLTETVSAMDGRMARTEKRMSRLEEDVYLYSAVPQLTTHGAVVVPPESSSAAHHHPDVGVCDSEPYADKVVNVVDNSALEVAACVTVGDTVSITSSVSTIDLRTHGTLMHFNDDLCKADMSSVSSDGGEFEEGYPTESFEEEKLNETEEGCTTGTAEEEYLKSFNGGAMSKMSLSDDVVYGDTCEKASMVDGDTCEKASDALPPVNVEDVHSGSCDNIVSPMNSVSLLNELLQSKCRGEIQANVRYEYMSGGQINTYICTVSMSTPLNETVHFTGSEKLGKRDAKKSAADLLYDFLHQNKNYINALEVDNEAKAEAIPKDSVAESPSTSAVIPAADSEDIYVEEYVPSELHLGSPIGHNVESFNISADQFSSPSDEQMSSTQGVVLENENDGDMEPPTYTVIDVNAPSGEPLSSARIDTLRIHPLDHTSYILADVTDNSTDDVDPPCASGIELSTEVPIQQPIELAFDRNNSQVANIIVYDTKQSHVV